MYSETSTQRKLSRKKAFSYARISWAHHQTEHSIKEQQHQIKRYANERWISIEKEFSEICSAFQTWGKKKLSLRTVFYEMLGELNDSIDYLLIFRYDRAIRLDKEFVLLQDVCVKYGIEICSITESFGQEQWPITNFLVRNSINLSQLYSEELSFKCKLGMRRAMLEGKIPGSGLPIGYIKTSKSSAIHDPMNAPIIKEIFQMYSTWKYSFEFIATYFSQKWFRNIRWKPFNYRDIEYLLGNEMYTGYKTISWNLKKYEISYYGAKKSGIFKERYKMSIEPIIWEELFELVQKIRFTKNCHKNCDNTQSSQKSNVGYFIFSQSIHCKCGRSYTGYYNKKKKIMYYGCSRSISKSKPEKCHEPAIQEYELFNEIYLDLEKMFLKPAELRKLTECLNRHSITHETDCEKKLKNNLNEIEIITEKQTNLTEKFVEWVISEENYTLLNKKYQDQKIMLEIWNERFKKIENPETENQKIFTYFLWTNWVIQEIINHFNVWAEHNFRTKLKMLGSNHIFSNKKPLTFAINGPLNLLHFNDSKTWWAG